ncbi:MAG: carboxypeptidase-like regulatory domain-containing protein, partial [Bacteroidota bacterium]|nr:carboxypeptidase-like regulatory domain-containing protein [Bacteroidota bacterium]
MKTLLSVIAFMLVTSLEPGTQIVIKGTVTDATGAPLSGVVIMVKGTNTSAMTGADGRYAITAGPEAKILVFSLRGKKPLEEPIAGRTLINVIMETDSQVSPVRDKETKKDPKPVYDEVMVVAEDMVLESAPCLLYTSPSPRDS